MLGLRPPAPDITSNSGADTLAPDGPSRDRWRGARGGSLPETIPECNGALMTPLAILIKL
jgi:hypothetical protein